MFEQAKNIDSRQ